MQQLHLETLNTELLDKSVETGKPKFKAISFEKHNEYCHSTQLLISSKDNIDRYENSAVYAAN